MSEAEFEQLATAAFKGERVASRRLAARSGVSELEALRRTLTLAAGAAGLAQLLAERDQLRQAEADRITARGQRKAMQLAERNARARPQPEAGTWLAWFDGSAHPNPGKIGIGALLCGPDGERVEISRRAGHGNSGEAEYLALTALLEAALLHKAPRLLVHGDSRVVIDDVKAAGLQGSVAAKGLEAHRARVMQLMQLIGEVGAADAVSLRWVPRHRNGEADRLSQQAVAAWHAEDTEHAAANGAKPAAPPVQI